MLRSTSKEILDIKNYNLSIIKDLNNLSVPIENYGIKFLTFRRIYNDGKMLHFSNNLSWLEHSFKCHFWQSTSSIQRIKKIKIDSQYAHIWNSSDTDYVYQAMYEYNLCNGLTIYDKRAKYVDLWAFATDRNNTEIFDLYINDLHIIKQFILYLHDKGYSLFFPKNSQLFIKNDKIINLSEEPGIALQQNKEIFDIKRYYYDENYDNYLTKKEFSCLYLISNGKSYKEISKILNVSIRTVETHINSIKTKTGNHFKNNLLKDCRYLLNMYK